MIGETKKVISNAIIESGVNMTSLEKAPKSDCYLPVEQANQDLLVNCQEAQCIIKVGTDQEKRKYRGPRGGSEENQ